MPEQARQFLDRHNAVCRAVVLVERPVGQRMVVKPLEPRLAVVKQLCVVEKLTGDQCHIGAHYGDIRIARTDVSAFDSASGVKNGIHDLSLQVGGQPVHVVDGHLEELHAAEIGPVPIGRRHVIKRLFHKP